MMLMTKNSGLALDVKAIGDDGTIEGYGSTFGNVDSYGEIVEPGAFAASLAEAGRKGRTIKMLWQHDPEQPIGVWDELVEDSKGLRVKGRLLITASNRAAEAHGLLREKALEGLSIGYRVVKAKPDPARENVILLTKLDLREVSIVTFAANERARVDAVKHLIAAGQVPTVRQFEEFLREEGGFSRSLAAAIAGKATPHLRGEPEAEADDPLQRFFEAMRA